MDGVDFSELHSAIEDIQKTFLKFCTILNDSLDLVKTGEMEIEVVQNMLNYKIERAKELIEYDWRK